MPMAAPLLITADHDCDTTDLSTDHTRDYAPLILSAHRVIAQPPYTCPPCSYVAATTSAPRHQPSVAADDGGEEPSQLWPSRRDREAAANGLEEKVPVEEGGRVARAGHREDNRPWRDRQPGYRARLRACRGGRLRERGA